MVVFGFGGEGYPAHGWGRWGRMMEGSVSVEEEPDGGMYVKRWVYRREMGELLGRTVDAEKTCRRFERRGGQDIWERDGEQAKSR